MVSTYEQTVHIYDMVRFFGTRHRSMCYECEMSINPINHREVSDTETANGT